MNGVTLAFRSISSGNTKFDYTAHEIKVLQLISAPTSTQLPPPKDGDSMFHRIVGVCLQSSLRQNPDWLWAATEHLHYMCLHYRCSSFLKKINIAYLNTPFALDLISRKWFSSCDNSSVSLSSSMIARFLSVIEDNIKTGLQGTGWKAWTGFLCGLTQGQVAPSSCESGKELRILYTVGTS